MAALAKLDRGFQVEAQFVLHHLAPAVEQAVLDKLLAVLLDKESPAPDIKSVLSDIRAGCRLPSFSWE